jgi:hypothetical protein
MCSLSKKVTFAPQAFTTFEMNSLANLSHFTPSAAFNSQLVSRAFDV